eukprot:131376_1
MGFNSNLTQEEPSDIMIVWCFCSAMVVNEQDFTKVVRKSLKFRNGLLKYHCFDMFHLNRHKHHTLWLKSILPNLTSSSRFNYLYHTTYHSTCQSQDIEYDVIKTPQEGREWMSHISAIIDEHCASNKHNTESSNHYSAQLDTINDDIWFGTDTEYSEVESRRSPYNNTQITMLQVYGNWTDPDKRKSNDPIMDKPVIFQLFDTEEETINNELLLSILPFLTQPIYSKVFHNYSVDAHTINNALRNLPSNYRLNGFAADSMHLARLLDAGSPENSLERLSQIYNPDGHCKNQTLSHYALELGILGLPGKIQDEMKRNPEPWYPYAALDPVVTFELACALRQELSTQKCELKMYPAGVSCAGWDIYKAIWRPFGELLVQMEATGFHIDAQYLKGLQEKGVTQRAEFIKQFQSWAKKVTGDPNIEYMNCQSKVQLGYLFFGDEKDDVQLKMAPRFLRENKELPRQFPMPMLNVGLTPLDKTEKGRIRFTGKILDELIEEPHGLSSCFTDAEAAQDAKQSVEALRQAISIGTQINTFILPLQKYRDEDDRLHYQLNLNTETGRLSCKSPNLQNQPSSKDIFQVRKAFTVQPGKGNTLIIADYAQIELRVLAYLSECESMIEAFESGGDFHSRTAASMYSNIQNDIDKGNVLLDGDGDFDVPLVKDKYKRERMHAKLVNFSIAYGKTADGLAADLNITRTEANSVLDKWYSDRFEVKRWQQKQMIKGIDDGYSYSLIGRRRKLFDPLNDLCNGNKDMHEKFKHFVRTAFNINGDDAHTTTKSQLKGKNKKMNVLWQQFLKQYKKENVGLKFEGSMNVPLNRYMRQCINSPVQSSAADIVVKSMLNIWENKDITRLGYKLLLQIHDEVILEGPKEHVEEVKDLVRGCMENPWSGMKRTVLFKADVKHSDNWYDGK